MAFSESLKLRVKKAADFTCCWCRLSEKKVEVHHIIPQAEGGEDILDNAAPLCSNCHTLYGGNPELRKEIRERREHWYEQCQIRRQSEWPIGLDVPLLEFVRSIEPVGGVPTRGIQFTDKEPTNQKNPPQLYVSIYFKNSRYFGDGLPPSNEKWLNVQADMRFAFGLRIQVRAYNQRDESEFRNFLRHGNDSWNLRSLTEAKHGEISEDVFHLWRENGENRLLIATFTSTNAMVSIHARFSDELARALDRYLEEMGFGDPRADPA